MKKVMVFTPTWVTGDGGLAMRPETEASVRAQDFEGEIVREIGTHNPFGGQSHRNVLAQYQRARELFLASDCEALLTLEHDMAMPPEAVRLLAAAIEGGAGIAYGVYMLRHGSNVVNAWEYVGENGLGESLSVHPGKLEAARAAGVARVSGVGWGCTMLSRETVEALAFHDGNGTNSAGDLPLAYDALFRGIRSVAVMDVACDHWDGELLLRPYGGGDVAGLILVEALQDVVVMDGRGTRPLVRGEVYELGYELAGDLMRAGYVKRVTSDELGVTSEEEATSDELRVTSEEGGEAGISAQDGRKGEKAGDLTDEAEAAAVEASERAVGRPSAAPRRRKRGAGL